MLTHKNAKLTPFAALTFCCTYFLASSSSSRHSLVADSIGSSSILSNRKYGETSGSRTWNRTSPNTLRLVAVEQEWREGGRDVL